MAKIVDGWKFAEGQYDEGPFVIAYYGDHSEYRIEVGDGIRYRPYTVRGSLRRLFIDNDLEFLLSVQLTLNGLVKYCNWLNSLTSPRQRKIVRTNGKWVAPEYGE